MNKAIGIWKGHIWIISLLDKAGFQLFNLDRSLIVLITCNHLRWLQYLHQSNTTFWNITVFFRFQMQNLCNIFSAQVTLLCFLHYITSTVITESPVSTRHVHCIRLIIKANQALCHCLIKIMNAFIIIRFIFLHLYWYFT